jgi:hypothetical protein
MGITPFGLQIRHFSYVFIDHRNERNEIVKFVPHFDNFTKWTILVVNKILLALYLPTFATSP